MLGLASNTSVMIGTPGYMAPEQITGDPVDHRADQFAIGVVFYELLAYTEAFPGDTLPMITHRILNEDPVPLGRLAPDAPPELVNIIHQTLKKNPNDRFADSESLRMAIARVRRDASNQGWNVNTIAVGRDTPSPPTGTRGTGSARRRQDDSVGVAQLTPPPDPRRTDREALARRRTMQVEASLTEARTLLAQGRLELALDACQQALTFDENHVGALRLEEEIEAAIRQSAPDEDPASSATMAAPPGHTRAHTLWPDLDGRPSEMVTRLDHPTPAGLPSPPSGAMDRTVLRVPVAAPPDATVIAPSRRTPPPVPPPVAPPPAPRAPEPVTSVPVAKAPVEPDSRTKSVPVPRPAANRSAPVAKKAPDFAADIVARSKVIVGAAGSVVSKVSRDRRMMGIAAVAVGIVIAVVVGTMLLGGPTPTGTVVIDAAPWGTITAIETDGGDPMALPSPPSTPLSLTLPAGTYQVAVAGPSPDSPPQRITVEVQAGAATVAPLIRFRALTPEEYFEEYLSSPTTPALDTPVTPGESTQSSPVPPPATVGQP